MARNQMVSGSLVSAITVPEVINQRLSHRVQPTRLRIAAAWARHARVPAHLHPRRQALIFRTPVTPDAHWRTLLAENAPTPQPGGPLVFLAQGDEDPVIPPPLTRDFARRLCWERTPVRYLAMPGVDHYTAAARSAAAVADWIAGRFAGVSPPDDCAALQ
jgi:hypothetical protein